MVPGANTSPPEISFYDAKTLEDARSHGPVQGIAQESQDHLIQTAYARGYYQFDPQKDPLLSQSQKIMTSYKEVIANKYTLPPPQTLYETKTCTEAKSLPPIICQETLTTVHMDLKEAYIIPSRQNYVPARSVRVGRVTRNEGRYDVIIPGYYETIPAVHVPEEIKVGQDMWLSTCEPLKAKAQKAECRLIHKICPMGKQTKEMDTYIDGKISEIQKRSVTKDCWQWVYQYDCSPRGDLSRGNPHETCAELRESGCEQMGSRCKEIKDGKCILYEQTYRCSKEVSILPVSILPVDTQLDLKNLPLSLIPESTPEQIAGRDNDEKSQSEDMNDALSKLMLLKEAQSEMRAQSDHRVLPRVFKGGEGQCTIAFANFKNCCKDKQGWGVDMGLAGCEGEDQDLAQKRQKNLCIEVGTYCAQKVLGLCIRKKRKYCCFPSKLARIIQEQGRGQLGKGFGEAEHPDCSGLTIEELSRIDFSHLNLSEIHQDVISKVRVQNPDVLKQRLAHRVQDMTSDVKHQFDRQGKETF
jgi:hypothetical protein